MAAIPPRLGTRMTVGMSGPPPGVALRPAAWVLYFATEDIAADVARASLGAKVVNPHMVVGAFGSMATLEDPHRRGVPAWQAGQHVGCELTEEPGSAAWYELYTSNLDQARDFYTALLGATADLMPGAPMAYYVLKHGEEMLGGVMQIDPAWGEFPRSGASISR